MKMHLVSLVILLSFLLQPFSSVQAKNLSLLPHEKLITVLQTNDIHGGVEARENRDGKTVGGFDFWGGVVRSIRLGLSHQYPEQAGVLLADSGDQFQGTLMSNYNEGKLVFRLMKLMRYDGLVPGNHAYDFGPAGWLEDRVNRNNPDKRRRGALYDALEHAKVPLIAANIYLKNEKLKTTLEGQSLEEDEDPDLSDIDWTTVRRPRFVKPYRIKKIAGVRVALIGLDHPKTPKMTTVENVSDLYFRDPFETYMEIQEKLKNRADIFVMMIHDGNTTQEFYVNQLVKKISEQGEGLLHLVLAGHTHFINHTKVAGVPIIQSGANGIRYGRVDLIWDSKQKKLVSEKMRSYAGVTLFHGRCAASAEDYCDFDEDSQKVIIEGIEVAPIKSMRRAILDAKKSVSHLSSRVLGHAHDEIKRHRYFESPLVNQMADALREYTKADIAMINTGGVRASLPAGDVTYENLFKVFPFSNHAVVISPMTSERLMKLLKRSVKSCGAYSALMQSGLNVTFERDCATRSFNGIDGSAKLIQVETVAGEVLYKDGSIQTPSGTIFQVATFDFLTEGGSGYNDFIGVPIVQDFGIFREALTSMFLKYPAEFVNLRDGRWRDLQPSEGVF